MKTRILFLLGSLLVICNSHAQSTSEPLMVGVTTPLTLKIETDKNVTKCNVEISVPGVGNIEKEITAPNYEAVIEITPQQEGKLNIQWKGKTKFRGFNTTPACTGTGSIVVIATASNAQIKTNAVKEVQITAAEKVADTSPDSIVVTASKEQAKTNAVKEVPVTAAEKVADTSSKNSTTMCKVLDQDIAGSYSGGCKDGLAHGKGVAKGKDEYSGMFVDGKQHGKGTYAIKGGHKYAGDFVDGKYHGKGTFTFANGDKYEGDFVDGNYNGKGTLTRSDGNKYVGDFVDGKFHGKGVTTWQSGGGYEGDFANGKSHGKGTLTSPSGDKYVGDFVDGKFQDTLAATKVYIEKAWACDPVLHKDRIVNWRLRQPKENGQLESFEDGLTRLSNSLLEFRKCPPDQPNDKEMRIAFISEYVGFWLLGGSLEKYGELMQHAKEGGATIGHVSTSAPYGWRKQDEIEKIEQKARQEEGRKRAALQATEDEARYADLKSGKVKVASMRDATMLVEAGSVFSLAGNPLLTPDNKDYKGDVRIDANENTLIRVQSELMGIQERRNPRYVYLKLTKKTVNFAPNSMRIGATISVIGKYVKNVNYSTVGGETKTAPVIECSYLGGPTGEEAASALTQMIQLRESRSK